MAWIGSGTAKCGGCDGGGDRQLMLMVDSTGGDRLKLNPHPNDIIDQRRSFEKKIKKRLTIDIKPH